MCMTGDEFVEGIAENPSSDQLRLVFADWLEEHGDADRAETIRLRFEFRHTDPDSLWQVRFFQVGLRDMSDREDQDHVATDREYRTMGCTGAKSKIQLADFV